MFVWVYKSIYEYIWVYMSIYKGRNWKFVLKMLLTTSTSRPAHLLKLFQQPVPELSDILTLGTLHTWQCNGDTLALPAMGWMISFVMTKDGAPGREDPGWVFPEDRQSQDLLKHWSWIHFDLTCGVSHHGRSCGDMRCWPALLVNPLLIYLVHPSCG